MEEMFHFATLSELQVMVRTHSVGELEMQSHSAPP